MKFNNLISKCVNGGNPERTMSLSGLVLHRFGNEHIHDGVQVAELLRTLPEVGRCMSYHFVIRRDGQIDQCLPLNRIGWHAMGHSKRMIGVALLGDFRQHKPTQEQMDSVVWMVQRFGQLLGRYDVVGHDELADGSKDPNKECPGKHLDVRQVIRQAKILNKAAGFTKLREAGLVFEVQNGK